MAEWLSSWLAEQEDRGSIPGLATWIFRDWLIISCFQVAIWITDESDVNPQNILYKQRTNRNYMYVMQPNVRAFLFSVDNGNAPHFIYMEKLEQISEFHLIIIEHSECNIR